VDSVVTEGFWEEFELFLGGEGGFSEDLLLFLFFEGDGCLSIYELFIGFTFDI
jgi:hypothetical protein